MTTPLSCIPYRVPAYRPHQTCLMHMVPPNPSPRLPQASITVPATAESARAVTAGHGRPGFLVAQPETGRRAWGFLRDGSQEKGSEGHRKQGGEPSENVVSCIRPWPESTGMLGTQTAPLRGRGRQFLLPSGEGHSSEKRTAVSSRQRHSQQRWKGALAR